MRMGEAVFLSKSFCQRGELHCQVHSGSTEFQGCPSLLAAFASAT